MKFLIQTFKGEIKHDFAFTLIQSCEYQNWLTMDNDFCTYVLSEYPDKEGYVPVGSVEFVMEYLKKYYNLSPLPKNIPSELLHTKFTGRKIINGTEQDITDEFFVKSNDKIKSFTDICSEAPKGNYQISEVVDFETEWRAFVYDKKLVGLQNYCSDFTIMPNVETIKEMILSYTSSPIAYTLDIAVMDTKTVVVEVHDFFSCGLYGFCDHNTYPFMLYRWFNN